VLNARHGCAAAKIEVLREPSVAEAGLPTLRWNPPPGELAGDRPLSGRRGDETAMLSAILTADAVLMYLECPCGSVANNDARYFRKPARLGT
jgi:hypothetical protein